MNSLEKAMPYVTTCIMWIATAVPVAIAVWTLKTATPIWFMLIPALMRFTQGKESVREEHDE